DPKYKLAWINLGVAYQDVGKVNEAIAAFRKQLEIDPSDKMANLYLGIALERNQNYAEAEAAFRKQIEISPLSASTYEVLADLLLRQHDYARAIPDLEKAAVLSPKNWQIQVYLGIAYGNTGRANEAVTAFERSVALSPQPLTWWAVAYNLADLKLSLDKAQQYAESALSSAQDKLRSVDLQQVKPEQLDALYRIGDYWNTLGWVHFQKGDLQRAKQYIQSAWLLTEDGGVGDHLAQVYEKLGDKQRAIHAYAL